MEYQRFTDTDASERVSCTEGARAVLIFKHSPACGGSRRAMREVDLFRNAHPPIPVFLVDVLCESALSRRIARDFGIEHASPQVILVSAGRAVWNESHGRITAELLSARMAIPDAKPAGPCA